MTTTQASELMKYMGDATRLKVVLSLSESPMHVGDLARTTNVPQALMSHHLAILRSSGIVLQTREGLKVRYELTELGKALHGSVIRLMA